MSRALLFEVEGEHFGFPLEAVQGVVRAAWPLRLPRPPYGCIGAIDVRGEILPLLDMGALLGMRRTLKPDQWGQKLVDTQFLLVSCGGTALALCVDKVQEISDADASVRLDAEHPSAGASSEGDRCVMIDPDTLVGVGRRRLLARAAQQARRPEGDAR